MKQAIMPTNFFTIDTLQLAERLQNSGLKQEIAEELSEVIKETHSQSLEGLATKQDMDSFRKEIRQDMAMLEQRVIIKLGSLMAIGIGIIAVLIKF